MNNKAALATIVIFIGGFAVLWLTGVTSTGHLLDNLVAGYLLAWGSYTLLSNVPRKEIQARFVLMTLAGVTMLGIAELFGMTGLINYQTLWARRGAYGLIAQVCSRPRAWLPT